MKAFIAIAVLALVALVNGQAGGHGHGHGHHHGHHDYYAYPAYKYSYGVHDKHTGDHKSASEVRDGHVTKGHYSLVQPDGVLRTVHYISTPHGGFQAQVVNKGVAGHPHVFHHHGHHGHHGHHHGGHHGGHLGGAGFL